MVNKIHRFQKSSFPTLYKRYLNPQKTYKLYIMAIKSLKTLPFFPDLDKANLKKLVFDLNLGESCYGHKL